MSEDTKVSLQDGLEDVVFFGPVDRQGRRLDGRISSDWPAWYFDVHVDDMKAEIEDQQRSLDMGLIHPTEVEITKRRIKEKKARMDEITSSKPKLKPIQKDRLHVLTEEWGEKIKDAMFTRDEMMMGLASVHEEAKRMTEPVFKVDPKIAAAMGVTVKGGKVSRDELARMWKIGRKYLGEPTNVEVLRRSSKTGTFRLDRDMREVEAS